MASGRRDSQTQAREVPGSTLSMHSLSSATPEELREGLTPLIDGYAGWLTKQGRKAKDLPDHLKPIAEETLHDAGAALKRLRLGLDHLLTNDDARQCFAFMNAVMRDQRIASQVAELRGADAAISIAEARAAVLARGESAAEWRPFQLAFILMQLPALTDPTEHIRSGDLAKVELLFFPTGGGKTEAYLGLAAFTFAIRRLQGNLKTDGRSARRRATASRS